jgi:outer membrane immunogenic protein
MKASGPALVGGATIALAMGLASGISSAPAADLVTKAPPPAPVAVTPWTGVYIGANVGAGFGNTKFYDIFPTPDFQLDANINSLGWLGGLQAGYNYQMGSVVLGVRGNFDWAGINSNFGCFTFGSQQCTEHGEWISTLVGRAGWLFTPSVLLYVDGGAAWMRDSWTDVAHTAAKSGGVPSLPGDIFTADDIRAGWVIGGGLEYRLSPSWSVWAEYDYMNFGERPVTFSDGLGNFFPEEIKQSVQTVTVGVNYYFGYGVAPVPVVTKEQNDESGKTIRGFSVFDVAKESVDGLVGGLFALSSDLDTTGPRLWVVGGSGWYRYPAEGTNIQGVYSTGDVLAGYGFEGQNYEINLLAGGSAENDMLSQPDPNNRVQGTAVGVKGRADIWVNPTQQTLFYGEGEYSTAFDTWYTSAKYGVDITNGKQIFAGPEVAYFGNERYNQWRVGAHLTQIKFGNVEVDVSAGYLQDSEVGVGAYGHVEMSVDF